MINRMLINFRKKKIHLKIRKTKELIKNRRITDAEKEYMGLLDDYRAFCRKATYLEKISIYHNLVYLYNGLKKKRRKEKKPMAVEKKAAAERGGKIKKAVKGKTKEKKEAEKITGKKPAGEKLEEQPEVQPVKKEAEPKKEIKKETEKKEIKEVAVKAGQLKTTLDELYFYIQQKGNVTLLQAASKFKVAREKIEEWAKILDEHGLIKIYYPAFTSPQLRSLEWIGEEEEKKRKKKMGGKKAGEKKAEEKKK